MTTRLPVVERGVYERYLLNFKDRKSSRLKAWLLRYILKSIRSAKVKELNSADANLKVSRY